MQVAMETGTQRSVIEGTEHLSTFNDSASSCEGDTPSHKRRRGDITRRS